MSGGLFATVSRVLADAGLTRAVRATSPAPRRRKAAHDRVTAAFLIVAALVLPTSALAQSGQIVEYYHLDALGSVRVVTDQTGQVVARHDFLPFGEEWNPPANAKETKLFTGHERDADTGLDYFGARYYRPQIGRFTTPDPVGADGANLYAYVGNNPLSFVDPLGLQKEGPPGSGSNPFKVTIWSCGTLEECLKKEAAEEAAREAFDRFVLEHWFQLLAGDVTHRAGALASPRTYLEFYGLSAVGGLGLGSGLHLFSSASLTTLNLQGAAQIALLSLPAGNKLAQMIARGGGQFAGNPGGFLSFARGFVADAISSGTYAGASSIGGTGATIYRNGTAYLVVARDGKILSYVANAVPGRGIVTTYLQVGGR